THTLVTTPANTADLNVAHALLHGNEKVVFADSGYQGAQKASRAGAGAGHLACGDASGQAQGPGR
ncbi:MAG: transposase, partial [Acidimicrobiia bacterium]